MKIVLTCGHPHSGYWLAHEALVAAGLAPARPSRRESMSAAELHGKILKAHGFDPFGAEDAGQIAPGKVWQDLAVDLFMGNLEQESWGWADADMVWLLDFWKDFDPQIRFVLVYSALEPAVGQMLQGMPLGASGGVERAAAAWAASNAEILRFHQRNPGRCLLVNVENVVHAPERFVEKAATAFGLGSGRPPPGYQPDRTGFSALASSLAEPFAAGCEQAQALYQELESVADLDSAGAAVREAEKCHAWQEYAQLLASLAQARRDAAQQAALGEGHARRAAGLEVALAKAETSLAAGQAEIATLQSQAAERAEENGLLSRQFHHAQEELDLKVRAHQDTAQSLAKAKQQIAAHEAKLAKQQAQIAQMAKARDEQAKRAAKLEEALAQAQASLAAGQAETAALQSLAAERAQENELLQIQLHQAQEAFERRVLEFKAHESAGQQALAKARQQIAAAEKKLAEQQAQIAQTAKARDEQAGRAAELEEALARAEASLSAGQAETAALQSQATQRGQENELLLLQLHQTQEEFETCFLKLKAHESAGEQSLAKARRQIAACEEKLAEQQALSAQAAKARDEQARRATAEAEKALAEQRALAAQAAKARDEQARRAAEAEKTLAEQRALAAQAAKVRDEQARRAAEAEKKLAEQRAQAAKALDEQAARAAEAEKKLAEQRAQAAQALDEQAARAADDREQRLAEQASVQAAAAALQSQNAELGQENELLLAQLRHVQQELELYFQQYRELADQERQEPAELARRPGGWYDYQLVEVVFDLRSEFAGDNWYYAEADGRWAGPGEVSSLKIPPLSGGRYEALFDVVDAMAPDILQGMEVSFNGTPLALSHEGDGYPALARAEFDADQAADLPHWEFQLKFPRLVCPADSGSDDERKLAIRLRSVRLRLADGQ